jgi:hypothetical protein
MNRRRDNNILGPFYGILSVMEVTWYATNGYTLGNGSFASGRSRRSGIEGLAGSFSKA